MNQTAVCLECSWNRLMFALSDRESGWCLSWVIVNQTDVCLECSCIRLMFALSDSESDWCLLWVIVNQTDVCFKWSWNRLMFALSDHESDWCLPGVIVNQTVCLEWSWIRLLFALSDHESDWCLPWVVVSQTVCLEWPSLSYGLTWWCVFGVGHVLPAAGCADEWESSGSGPPQHHHGICEFLSCLEDGKRGMMTSSNAKALLLCCLPTCNSED